MVLSKEDIKKELDENTTYRLNAHLNLHVTRATANDLYNPHSNQIMDTVRTHHLVYGGNADMSSNSSSLPLSKPLLSKSAEKSANEPERQNIDYEPRREEYSASRKLTNFSIDQILRADFGPKRCSGRYDYDRVRQLPWKSVEALSATSSLFSPLCCPTSRLFSATAFSAFSPAASKTAFVHNHPSPRLSPAEKYYTPNILTPPPSSPESSTSSLSPSSTSSLRYHTSTASPKKDTSSAAYASGVTSTVTSSDSQRAEDVTSSLTSAKQLRWPAWVYCTRYSDRPSSGPRYRKPRQNKSSDKRPRTAFSTAQLQRLRTEFQDCPYLSESRRISLARELGLSESQVKIWFQNKRAKLKKGCGVRNPLAQMLMEEGLYNHSTIVVRDDDNNDNISDTNHYRNSQDETKSCNSGGGGGSVCGYVDVAGDAKGDDGRQ